MAIRNHGQRGRAGSLTAVILLLTAVSHADAHYFQLKEIFQLNIINSSECHFRVIIHNVSIHYGVLFFPFAIRIGEGRCSAVS